MASQSKEATIKQKFAMDALGDPMSAALYFRHERESSANAKMAHLPDIDLIQDVGSAAENKVLSKSPKFAQAQAEPAEAPSLRAATVDSSERVGDLLRAHTEDAPRRQQGTFDLIS